MSTPQYFVADDLVASRMADIPRSFIREILEVAIKPGMITFAGGLPNRDLFPAEALQRACNKVFDICGPDILQYSGSQGLAELRQQIATRYQTRGTQHVKPENILITNGSQQALDLLSKILVNKGERVILEEPSYLGAIQAIAVYKPTFVTVPLNDDGIDIPRLKEEVAKGAKFMYLIPNFQNPSGVSYSDETRRAVADIVRGTRTFIIEDDPYGELRFEGQHKTSFMNLIPENTILLGTFSKTVVPAFRLGWVVIPPSLMEPLIIAKQATDLHTNSFAQRVLSQYLLDNDPDSHIEKIVAKYAQHKKAMVESISRHFPKNVTHTNPEGGMFLWVKLPKGVSALKLFDVAVNDGVCVVPGLPFYVTNEDAPALRLSFSCVDEPTIEEGISRLGKALHQLCG